MPAGGRVREGASDRGSGFAIAPRLVVTANHCVRGGDLARLSYAVDGDEIVVERVEQDESLDVALLRLAADVPSSLIPGAAASGAGWRVESQPRPDDPMLTGTITTVGWRITNQRGYEVDVIQMLAAQNLESHEGYSGSPVTSPPGTSSVVGVLVEQVLSRGLVVPGEPARSANVLFAVPIGKVIERFHLAAEGLEVIAQATNANVATRPNVADRFSGLRVATAVSTWLDREAVTAELRGLLLDEEHRVISIVGRRGIGKSAIVSRVLAEFEQPDPARNSDEDLSPLVYLSAGRGGGLTLATVYQRVADLWDTAPARELALHWQSAGIDALAEMWDQLRDRRPVIVLDNLDALQGPVTRELADPQLEALLDSACRTACRATILTTSQVPLTLPVDLSQSVHVIEIVDGLDCADAVKLIRASATRGAERLKSIPDDQLAVAAARVEGVPRGLQKLALMLDRRPARIKQLLASDALPAEVLDELVSTTYGAMPEADQLVMQTLALAASPLAAADVASLLDGLLGPADIEEAIDHLIDAGEINEHAETALLELHPLDADHVRGVLVDHDHERQVLLDTRLADWWTRRAEPQERWRTLDDVRPSKREYAHRWRAGQHTHALRVITDAAEWLARWGEGSVVAGAIEAARDKLAPSDATGQLYVLLGEARLEFFVGSLDTSLAALHRARNLAQAAGLVDQITDLDLWIGAAYRHRNEPAKAIETLRTIADAPADASVTRNERQLALFDLGLSLLYEAEHDEAKRVATRLDALVAPADPPHAHAMSANLRALDAIASDDYDAADAAATAAIGYYDQTAYWTNRGYMLNVRGLAKLGRGDAPGALADLQEGAQVAADYRHVRLQGLCATNLAWAHLHTGEHDDARIFAELAGDLLVSAGVTIAPAARALAGAISAASTGASMAEVRKALANASHLTQHNPDIHAPSAASLDVFAAHLTAVASEAATRRTSGTTTPGT